MTMKIGQNYYFARSFDFILGIKLIDWKNKVLLG